MRLQWGLSLQTLTAQLVIEEVTPHSQGLVKLLPIGIGLSHQTWGVPQLMRTLGHSLIARLGNPSETQLHAQSQQPQGQVGRKRRPILRIDENRSMIPLQPLLAA